MTKLKCALGNKTEIELLKFSVHFTGYRTVLTMKLHNVLCTICAMVN